jgi:hypothetical protein
MMKFFRDHNGKRAMFGAALLGAALVSYFGFLAGFFEKRYDSALTMTMFITGTTLLGLTSMDRHPPV